MNDQVLSETPWGFKWGPLEVTRVASDDKIGWVLMVTSPETKVEIRATPKGTKPLSVKVDEWTS